MRKRRGGIGCCCFVVTLATSPAQGFAAEYYMEPSLSAGYEFDDNRSLSDPSESASTWKFSPSVNFARQTGNSSILGIGQVDVEESNRDDVDSTNLFFSLLPAYRTERNVWTVNATYRRDTTLRTDILAPEFAQEPVPSDSSLTEAPSTIPGEDLPDLDDPNLQDPDIGRREQKAERNLLVISPQWRRELTPRLGMGLGYRYIETFYSDAEGTDLVDSRSHSGNANLSYAWSRVDDISVITSFLNFQDDEDSEFDTYRAEFGWTRRFSETLDGTITVGPEYTDESEDDGSGLSYSFGLGINKKLERSDVGLFFRRAVAPSEDGNALQRNQIDIRWAGDISPRWSFGFLARAFRNEDAGDSPSSGNEDRYYAQVEPTVNYALTEYIGLSLGYRFRWEDSDESATGHAVALSVGYQLGRFGFSR